jgi:hypothetical protein
LIDNVIEPVPIAEVTSVATPPRQALLTESPLVNVAVSVRHPFGRLLQPFAARLALAQTGIGS